MRWYAIYEPVLERIRAKAAQFVPGVPTDPATIMGAIVSKQQYESILGFIASAKAEGARLLCRGGPPSNPMLQTGYFIEPTVFADVTPPCALRAKSFSGRYRPCCAGPIGIRCSIK